MAAPRYPALFQINTRVRLSELAAALGRRATLDDFPDAELDRLAADGFDIVWFLGVWQTGEAARRVSRWRRTTPGWPSARSSSCRGRSSSSPRSRRTTAASRPGAELIDEAPRWCCATRDKQCELANRSRDEQGTGCIVLARCFP
jgi:hypothetical protein